MFTGIVQEQGVIVNTINKNGKIQLHIKGEKTAKNTKIDESVAVNGCCLTAIEVKEDIIVFDVLPESIKKTNLADLKINSVVNLECALTLKDKLGGHIIQGHVDTKANIANITQDGASLLISFKMDSEYVSQLIPKGFVAIDGISLTVVEILKDGFSVMIIPHTFKNTRMQYLKENDSVNIEIDFMTKTILNHINKLQLTGK